MVENDGCRNYELDESGLTCIRSCRWSISDNVQALTFAICGPILVKLTNRFSSRPVLLWTLLIFIIGNGIIAVAPNFSILVVGRIISSAAAALIIVKVLAITAMLSAPKNRGKMIGLVYTGFSGANVFGVPIGTVIGDLVGWRYTFLFLIIVSIIVGFLMMIYLPKDQEIQRGPVNHDTHLLKSCYFENIKTC
ncbi:MFS transporter [Staphylococcus aureus]